MHSARLVATMVALLGAHAATAGPVSIAVASNFRATAERVTEQFSKDTGKEVRISSASTGKLYAQIVNGAPFDVFLAADTLHPRLLRDAGLVAGDEVIYATGGLVLWSGDPAVADQDCRAALEELAGQHLAIANPDTAPYGRAAREFLVNSNLWEALSGELVYGENVAQTLHFAVSRNARFALIASAQAVDPRLSGASCSWAVPPELHGRIEQSAVLLRRARDNSAARQFLDYLQSPTSQDLIRKSGYGVP